MNANKTVPAQTIVIAADVGGFSLATLGLAVQMAASTKSHLQGYFVEDEDLLQLTSLPISREISLATARERPVDVERMQRALRALATQFEQSLKREANASQVGYSFEYVRGRVYDIGLRADAAFSCTIIDRTVTRSRRAPPTVASARVLWMPGSGADETGVMHIVLEQFRHQRIQLTLAGDQAQTDAVANIGDARGNRALSLRHWTVDRLLEHIGKGIEFDFAIISRHQAAGHLALILRSLNCPVILVA